MRIRECHLTRLQIPFRKAFKHAAAVRSHGDAIIIQVLTESGKQGFGEIQARPYVSGEDNDDIWGSGAEQIAQRLFGKVMRSPENIVEVLGGVEAYTSNPAAIGGFDTALVDALELDMGVDWGGIFVGARNTETTKCLTVGQDYVDDHLRNQARLARLGRYGVVKLKVGGVSDAARVGMLREWLGADIAIRLDANGELTFAEARELLQRVAEFDVQSLEEPLGKHSVDLPLKLAELHAATGIPLIADESVCTAADLDRFKGTDAFQGINVRVGKGGGSTGAGRLLRKALDYGFFVVAGTMVGETAVLLRSSKKMLENCSELDYVEGLDQAKRLLEKEVIIQVKNDPTTHFQWLHEDVHQYAVATKTVS